MATLLPKAQRPLMPDAHWPTDSGAQKKEERGKKYRGMSGIDWQAEKAKADDDSLQIRLGCMKSPIKKLKKNSVSKQDVHFTTTEGLH